MGQWQMMRKKRARDGRTALLVFPKIEKDWKKGLWLEKKIEKGLWLEKDWKRTLAFRWYQHSMNDYLHVVSMLSRWRFVLSFPIFNVVLSSLVLSFSVIDLFIWNYWKDDGFESVYMREHNQAKSWKYIIALFALHCLSLLSFKCLVCSRCRFDSFFYCIKRLKLRNKLIIYKYHCSLWFISLSSIDVVGVNVVAKL